jgi:hypothetical protein
VRRRTKTIKKGRNYSIQFWRGIKGKNNEFIVNIFTKGIDINPEWIDKLYNLFGCRGQTGSWWIFAWRYDTIQEAEQALSIAILKGLL